MAFQINVHAIVNAGGVIAAAEQTYCDDEYITGDEYGETILTGDGWEQVCKALAVMENLAETFDQTGIAEQLATYQKRESYVAGSLLRCVGFFSCCNDQGKSSKISEQYGRAL